MTVTITGNSATEVYNAAEQSVTGYTTDVGDKTITVALAEGKSAEAKGTDAGTYNMGLTKDSFVVESKNYSNIKVVVVDGALTITPITNEVTVTITGNSDSKTYTGSEQSVTGFTTDVNGKAINVALAEGAKAEAKGTDVGTHEMGLTKDSFVVESKNYSNIKVVVVDGALTITPTDAEYVIKVSGKTDTVTYNGKEQSVTGYTVSDYDSSITLTGPAQEEAIAKGTNAGTYQMNLKAEDFSASSDNYTSIRVEVEDGALTITPTDAEYVIKVSGKTDTVTYNGKEQSVTGYTVSDYDSSITLTGPAQEEAIAKGTNAGTYQMNLKAEDFSASSDNYTSIRVEVEDGWLKITNASIEAKFTGESKSVTYNGKEQEITGITAEGLLEGHEYENLSYSAKGTDADTYNGVFSGVVKIVDANGTDVTENYAVETVPGTLTITPVTDEVTVTITGNNDSQVYDGKAHDVTGYTVSIDNALYTEADFSFTGTAIASRTDVGTTNMGLSVEQFVNTNENFDKVTFVVTDGYMEITPVTDEVVVTITGNHNSHVYDGNEYKAEGYTVSIDNALYSEDDFSFTGTASASRTDVGTTNMGLTTEQFVNTSENFSKVTFVVTDGYMEITPKTINPDPENPNGITVDAPQNSVYDGEPHKFVPTVKDGEKVLNEGTDYTVSYSTEDFTNVTGDITVTITGKGNYEGTVTKTYQILKRDVTLRSAGNSKVYDGEPLTRPYVEEGGDGFVKGEVSDIKATGSITNVGNVPNTITYIEGDSFKADNYNITKEEGTLTVTPVINPVIVTITEHSGEFTYDGTEKSVKGYDVKISNKLYKEADFTFTGNAVVTRIEAGTYPMELKPADFTNNSDNFSNVEFVIEDGTLVITRKTINPDPENPNGITVDAPQNSVYDGEPHKFVPTVKDGEKELVKDTDYTVSYSTDNFTDVTGTITVTVTGIGNYSGTVTKTYEITKRPVTISTEAASKVYDGDPLTAGGSIKGIVDGETVTFNVTGSQTEVGTSKNTYVLTWDGTAQESNYSITGVDVGTLTVSAQTINPGPDPENPDPNYGGVEIGTLTDEVYNGQSWEKKPTVTDKNGNALDEGTDYTLAWSADTVNVGTVTVTVTGIGNYTGTVERTYRITPATVIVTADSKAKTFNSADPALTATVTGLIGTDTVEYTLARAAGEDVGNYAITAAGAETQGNYIVRFVPGTMVITGFIDDPPVVDIPELPPLPEAIDDELTPLDGPQVTVDDPVNIDDEATPLAGEHECCILHFLILCAALLIELLYINDKKKRQQKIFEMRRELNK